MRFNLDTNNLANVLDRSTSVGKVTYNQLTLLDNNEKPSIAKRKRAHPINQGENSLIL
jgi:ribosomal protein S28E/S33